MFSFGCLKIEGIGYTVTKQYHPWVLRTPEANRPLVRPWTGPRAVAVALEVYPGALDGTLSQAAELQDFYDPRGIGDGRVVVMGGTVLAKEDRRRGLDSAYKTSSPTYGHLFGRHLVFCDEGPPCNPDTLKQLARMVHAT